jgi:hypothetical protein
MILRPAPSFISYGKVEGESDDAAGSLTRVALPLDASATPRTRLKPSPRLGKLRIGGGAARENFITVRGIDAGAWILR